MPETAAASTASRAASPSKKTKTVNGTANIPSGTSTTAVAATIACEMTNKSALSTTQATSTAIDKDYSHKGTTATIDNNAKVCDSEPSAVKPPGRAKTTGEDLDKTLDSFLFHSLVSETMDAQCRRDLMNLHDLIRKHAPQLEPTNEFPHTLAYGKYHYHHPMSGKEGEWYKIGVTVRKTVKTITFNATRDGMYMLEAFDTKSLGNPTHVGRDCIRFTSLSDLNLRLLKKIIETTAKADVVE